MLPQVTGGNNLDPLEERIINNLININKLPIRTTGDLAHELQTLRRRLDRKFADNLTKMRIGKGVEKIIGPGR